MASRSAGTLLTEFNAAYVPPGLMPGREPLHPPLLRASLGTGLGPFIDLRPGHPHRDCRYQGHVPSVAFSFGSPYGTSTLKYFQDHRNAAMEKSHTPFSQGGHFPTLFATSPHLLLTACTSTRDRWLHEPSSTRFSLDSHRSTERTHFYQTVQEHRKYYQDKTGMVPLVASFVLPVRERERPPLSPKEKWHLLRLAPENLKTYQTFLSGKRVSPQERKKRDCYFEFRA
ncbi:Protein FAM166C [Plecturocebus cupreus]